MLTACLAEPSLRSPFVRTLSAPRLLTLPTPLCCIRSTLCRLLLPAQMSAPPSTSCCPTPASRGWAAAGPAVTRPSWRLHSAARRCLRRCDVRAPHPTPECATSGCPRAVLEPLATCAGRVGSGDCADWNLPGTLVTLLSLSSSLPLPGGELFHLYKPECTGVHKQQPRPYAVHELVH